MGFAAAIADVIAPPPRAERPNPAAGDDGHSFADHLDAQAETEQPRAEKPTAERPRRADNDQDETNAAAEAAAQAPQPRAETAAPAAPPLLAQLFAELKATAADDAKPDASAPTPAPAPRQGDGETAPQTGPLGAFAAQAQQAAEPGPEAAPAIGLVAPQPNHRAKSGPKASAEPTQETAAEVQSHPAPQQQAPTESAVVPPVSAPEAQTPRPQDLTINANAPRTFKAQAAQPRARAPDAPAQPDTAKAATPLQQALAALRDGAGAANSGEKNTDIKMAAPAQSVAPQTAAALAQAPTQASQITAEHAAQRVAPASTQVAREIVRRFNGGNTSFDLRLDPPELGRIDVRLEVSRDHKVTAVIAADSPQALSELVRHSRELEASLQSAGLDLAENGLSFDLSQSGQRFADDGDDAGSRQAAAQSEEPAPTPIARPLGLESWRGVRIDVTA